MNREEKIHHKDGAPKSEGPWPDDEEFEPVFGLPEVPPAGEHILWQGEPTTWAIATRVMHIRAVGIYFTALFIWSVVDKMGDGMTLGAALSASSILLVPFLTLMLLLAGTALAIAKTTVYTMTNKRLVIRAGVAISKSVNLPFALIENAATRSAAGDTLDITIKLGGDQQPKYLMLWPHIRLGRWRNAEPTLRGLKDGERVAQMLSDALTAYHGIAQNQSRQQTSENALTDSDMAGPLGAHPAT